MSFGTKRLATIRLQRQRLALLAISVVLGFLLSAADPCTAKRAKQRDEGDVNCPMFCPPGEICVQQCGPGDNNSGGGGGRRQSQPPRQQQQGGDGDGGGADRRPMINCPVNCVPPAVCHHSCSIGRRRRDVPVAPVAGVPLGHRAKRQGDVNCPMHCYGTVCKHECHGGGAAASASAVRRRRSPRDTVLPPQSNTAQQLQQQQQQPLGPSNRRKRRINCPMHCYGGICTLVCIHVDTLRLIDGL